MLRSKQHPLLALQITLDATKNAERFGSRTLVGYEFDEGEQRQPGVNC